MSPEIARLKFEFNTHALPLPRLATYKPLGFTIGKSRFYDFNDIPKFAANHSKKKNDALFIQRRVL